MGLWIIVFFSKLAELTVAGFPIELEPAFSSEKTLELSFPTNDLLVSFPSEVFFFESLGRAIVVVEDFLKELSVGFVFSGVFCFLCSLLTDFL